MTIRCALLLVCFTPFSYATSALHQTAYWGYMAQTGTHIIAQHNEQRLFTPASVLKLLTVTAALHHLGPEFSVTCKIYSNTTLIKGQLQGHLYIEGAGDPSWNERYYKKHAYPLQQLVNDLKKKGLHTIHGNLVINNVQFSGPSQAPQWSKVDSVMAYGAPASTIALDENLIWLSIQAGKKVGHRGKIRSKSFSFQFKNSINTVAKKFHGQGSVTYRHSLDKRIIQVIGDYPISEPKYHVKIAMPDPEWHVANVFRTLLKKHRIKLKGNIVFTQKTFDYPVLATYQSPPMKEWLEPILKYSKNWYAENLLRIMAYHLKGEGRLSTGLEILETFLQTQLQVPTEHFSLKDASGLARTNLITPETINKLLQFILQQHWKKHLINAMASPGKGTLIQWRKLENIHAKTGSLQNSVALAGFKKQNKEITTFVIFANHHPGKQRTIRNEISKWINRF